MKEMQFAVVVVMVLMCSALILLMPRRVRRDAVYNRSCWLMTGALALIGVQFLIQYVTGLRAMGVTQAVLVNLALLLPASGLMSLAILNLQRQGRLTVFERWLWLAVSILVDIVLAVVVWTDGHPLEQLSERVRWTEAGLGVVYAAMQIYYSIQQFRELQRMEEAVENYYDRERRGLTQWIKHAIGVTGLMAVFVPVFIFVPNILLIVYGLAFFWGIFMMWFCFVRYFLSNDMKRMREAEENAEQSTLTSDPSPLTSDAMQHVSSAVERWMATGGHLKAGITSPVAASAMNIPRYQLTAWVKASGHTSFTRWITSLRIDEAKRMLHEHPEWTNEAVADHCGFSRTHFQKIFKQETGIAPSEYAAQT